MKVLKIFVLLMILFTVKSLIAIKRLTEDDLKHFLLYKSNAVVSPYKYEETVKTPALANYLPVKIKLIGGPFVTLSKKD